MEYKLTRLAKLLEARYFYLAFCIICFLLALILGLLYTQSGPGLSPDSINYITTGENLYHGKGFTTLTGVPYTVQPPFYPLSITSFMYLGIDSEQAARLIPVLCFALLMFPTFFLAKRISGIFTGYLTCLIFLVFTPFLFITSYAWTEMIYILFSTLAIFFLVEFHQSQSSKEAYGILSLAGLFVALAILTRYIGVTLFLVGLIAIVIKNKSLSRRLAFQATLFSCLSTIPIIPWIYRNFVLTSYATGMDRGSSTVGFITNIINSGRVIIQDYCPEPFGYIGLAIIAVIFTVLFTVLMRIRPTAKYAWIKYLKDYYLVLLYPLIYLITLIVLRSIWSFDPINTRLVSPAYPFFILTVATFTSYGYKQLGKHRLRYRILLVFIALYLLFMGIQSGHSLQFYWRAKDGLQYNNPYWRNNQAIEWAGNNVPDEVSLYSDRYDVIQFRLKRLTYSLPHSEAMADINIFTEELQNQGNLYIICFKDYWHCNSLLSNSEIAEINGELDLLVEVIDFPEATIWKINL